MSIGRKLLNLVLGEDTLDQLYGRIKNGREDCFPAEIFEKVHRLSGLSRRYVYPEWVDSSTLGNHFVAEFGFDGSSLPLVRRINDEMVSPNPTLSRIERDGTCMQEFHLLDGVASRLNANDVDFFMPTRSNSDDGLDALALADNARTKRLMDDLEPVSGRHRYPSGIKSPATFEGIEQQVAARMPPPDQRPGSLTVSG